MAVNSLTLDYTALKNLLSTGMCEHQAYKQKVESNMAVLDSTWFGQPCAKPSPEWMYILAQPHVFDKLSDIYAMLSERRAHAPIYPPSDCIFKALTYTIPENVKCVIICHDPYPKPGQATGLCLASETILPSLRNFFKVVYASYGFDYQPSPKPPTGDLEYLAEQGVLLLNSALTIEENSPGSHVDKWKPVIEAILTAVYQANPRCAFLAMGKAAKEALSAVENNLKSGPLASGGPKPFWYEKHPLVWIRQERTMLAALETFNQVRNYLNGLQRFQLIQNSKGLWQYGVVSEYINWMPYFMSSKTSVLDKDLLVTSEIAHPGIPSPTPILLVPTSVDIPSPTSDIHDPTLLEAPNPAAPNQTAASVTPQQPPGFYSWCGSPLAQATDDFAEPGGSGPGPIVNLRPTNPPDSYDSENEL